MSGVITHLGSIGKQDIETMIKPSQTFWKANHAKHTPFAIEPKEFEFQGTADWNRRVTCTIPRTGDLLKDCFLVMTIGRLDNGNGNAYFTDDLGRACLDSIVVELGSVQYDILQPEYMHAYEELSVLKERQLGYLTGKSGIKAELVEWGKHDQKLYVHIPFFWSDETSNSLPLVALHLTDVKIHVRWKPKAAVIKSTDENNPYVINDQTDALIKECYIMSEIVYLDDPERDWFADSALKYLLHQVQFLGTNSVPVGVSNVRFDLHLNHPTKELIVLLRRESSTDALEYFNFSGEEAPHGDAFKTLSLKLNGNDRFTPRDPYYFRTIQPKLYHTRIPDKHIYVVCFALKPEILEPTGSINFSRIDNVRLQLDFSQNTTEPAEVFIFARNINVCTISSGVAILRYAS